MVIIKLVLRTPKKLGSEHERYSKNEGVILHWYIEGVFHKKIELNHDTPKTDNPVSIKDYIRVKKDSMYQEMGQ